MSIACVRAALRALFVAAVFTASLVRAAPLEVTVMTRNLYVGADLGPVIETFLTNPPAVPGVVASTFAKVEDTNPVERMTRIANEILTYRPQVVGLQELTLLQTRTPSGITGSPGPLLNTFDFYASLNTALGGASSPYTLVTRLTGFPVAAVGFDPVLMPVPSDIILIDGSAILVRNDVTVLGFDAFAYNNITIVPGLGLPIVRGISYVDIEIAGVKMRVANTHLDSIDPAKNFAQSQELADFLDTSPYRQIALGDFNSIAEPVDGVFIPTGSDANMLANGFRDSWLDKGMGPGFTWRDDELLNNPDPGLFTQRLDYVFHRDGFITKSVNVIGDELDPNFSSPPFWASDHAGVLATLTVVPEPGTLVLLGIAFAGFGFARRAGGRS